LKKQNQKPSSHSLGKLGEEFAIDYLKGKKFQILKTGFRFHRGEIDIIAYDEDMLVFVEVKTRRDQQFGSPEEAVTPSKQEQLRRIAQGFLTLNRLEDTPCRFDVLALVIDENQDVRIKHFIDAF
jgi:putative endonuclease